MPGGFSPYIDLVDSETVVDVSGDYTQKFGDSVIYATGDITITLLDPTTASKRVIIKSLTGTVTLAVAGSGTSEVSTLTPTQVAALGPNGSVWRLVT